jgi:deoxyadenosine/deoxycytidine kinase
MWIAILGAPGTGKTLVAEMLSKDGFDLLDYEKPEAEKPFKKDLKHFTGRLRNQLIAAQVMNRKDVVTIRSIWDTYGIFIKASRRLQEISEDEFSIFKQIYDSFPDGGLEPPHAVIWTRTDKMSAFNRMALRGVEINQEHFNLQLAAYEELMSEVKVPIIEIDTSQMRPEAIKKNLDFGIASLKASNLSSQSLWSRSFFR